MFAVNADPDFLTSPRWRLIRCLAGHQVFIRFLIHMPPARVRLAARWGRAGTEAGQVTRYIAVRPFGVSTKTLPRRFHKENSLPAGFLDRAAAELAADGLVGIRPLLIGRAGTPRHQVTAAGGDQPVLRTRQMAILTLGLTEGTFGLNSASGGGGPCCALPETAGPRDTVRICSTTAPATPPAQVP
jgi:hypothetical protein